MVKKTKAEIQCKSSRKNNQGCICKKSHCQKKYCECFNAGIACTDSCKCLDCENTSCNHSKNGQRPNSDENKNKIISAQALDASKPESSLSLSRIGSIPELNA